MIRLLIIGLIIYAGININKLTDKQDKEADKPHVGLIDIKGAIMAGMAGSADNLAKSIQQAYKSKGTKAVVLRINSPGGSPVQADYMFNTINYYKKKYPKIKVYAVCVDACTSAAYYIASAADEIYANPSSIVGSIGVLYNGFGFVDGMHKLGIERRLITAGRNKNFLDPFSPVEEKQQEMLKNMLGIIHKQFEESVVEGRGSRLKVNDETFSGLFWTGVQAKSMGLIDGFASSGEVVRNIVKLDDTIDYTVKPNYLEKFAKNIGLAMSEHMMSAMGFTPGFKF